mgnify:CR=1 FL=1
MHISSTNQSFIHIGFNTQGKQETFNTIIDEIRSIAGQENELTLVRSAIIKAYKSIQDFKKHISFGKHVKLAQDALTKELIHIIREDNIHIKLRQKLEILSSISEADTHLNKRRWIKMPILNGNLTISHAVFTLEYESRLDKKSNPVAKRTHFETIGNIYNITIQDLEKILASPESKFNFEKKLFESNREPLAAFSKKEDLICNLSGDNLNSIKSFNISCNDEIVSKGFIEQYKNDFLRRQQEPHCPFCKQTIHFKEDLETQALSTKSYTIDNLTINHFKNILLNKDIYFAALTLNKIKNEVEKSEAFKLLVLSFINHNQLHSHIDDQENTLIHILATHNQKKLIELCINKFNMQHNTTNKFGDTALSIATENNFIEQATYLRNL